MSEICQPAIAKVNVLSDVYFESEIKKQPSGNFEFSTPFFQCCASVYICIFAVRKFSIVAKATGG